MSCPHPSLLNLQCLLGLITLAGLSAYARHPCCLLRRQVINSESVLLRRLGVPGSTVDVSIILFALLSAEWSRGRGPRHAALLPEPGQAHRGAGAPAH